jgi:Ni/Co efflux regulator RcnB
MKSTANALIRISLALVFCLGMFATANPAALGQRDRERGDRDKCQKECQERYKEQTRQCKDRRGRERRECQRRADKERRECRDKCRH